MAIAGGLALAGEAQANIVYNVNLAIGAGGVVGTITTDGHVGLLGASDILAWNLTETGNGGATFHLDNGSSGVEVGNNANMWDPTLGNADLTADANHIYFNFSGTDGGYFGFQTPPIYGGQNYWSCGAHNNLDSFEGFGVVPVLYSDPSSIYQAESGNQIIASVATTGPLVLSSPRCDGTNFVFNFGTVSNQSYSVWANADLATTNWVSYTNLVGDGYVQKIATTITNGQPSFFYRLSSP